jgi:NADPH:quinone reductase-like Zn-dependent oxidoreductase
MSSTSQIAYLAGFKRSPLVIRRVEDDRFPDDDEIVVKVAAVAINQVDWKQQEFPWDHFQYPLALGEDVAGEVVDVGGSVTRFQPGDRVLGHALVLATRDERHAAFQNYAVLAENMASPIPKSLPFEQAAVLPLAVSTASAALFQTDDGLGLPAPSITPSKSGKCIVIWGGTSAVGGNAVQLAVAAGVEVIATASPSNIDTVKKLGASEVVDHRSPTATDEIKKLLAGRTIVGAFDAIGSSKKSYKPLASAIQDAVGNKCVVSTGDEVEEGDEVKGVQFKPIFAIAIRDNDIGKMVYEDFLPEALASGRYAIFPEPNVAGKGLDAIQGAFGESKKASASKTVVVVA